MEVQLSILSNAHVRELQGMRSHSLSPKSAPEAPGEQTWKKDGNSGTAPIVAPSLSLAGRREYLEHQANRLEKKMTITGLLPLLLPLSLAGMPMGALAIICVMRIT